MSSPPRRWLSAEALRPEFKLYAKAVVDNAKALAERLKQNGFDIVSGGTDNHLMLVDLRPKSLTGNVAEKALERAHITCNKNGIPYDPQKPTVTSGIRLGTPAATSRGFGVKEFQDVADFITEALEGLAGKERRGERRDGGGRSPQGQRADRALPDLLSPAGVLRDGARTSR